MDKSVKIGSVIATPAGQRCRDPARGGEFERMMERLEQLRWELDMKIAAITPTSGDGDKARRLSLMRDYEVVRWAIEELRKHE